MTMNTYIEQIFKHHFVPALKQLAMERREDMLLEEDNDGAHGTRSARNKVVAIEGIIVR